MASADERIAGSMDGIRGVRVRVWLSRATMSQKMSALHSSFAFLYHASPSCSASNARMRERAVNMSSGTEVPSSAMMEEAMKGGIGMQLRLGVLANLAFVFRVESVFGSGASVMLFQVGFGDGGLDAKMIEGSIWAGYALRPVPMSTNRRSLGSVLVPPILVVWWNARM